MNDTDSADKEQRLQAYRKAKKRVQKFVETETGDEFGDPRDAEILAMAMKDVARSLDTDREPPEVDEQ